MSSLRESTAQKICIKQQHPPQIGRLIDQTILAHLRSIGQYVCISSCNLALTFPWTPLTPQVLGSFQLKQEVTHMEEERVQVVNNIDELEQKVKELDNQMDESIREVVPCPRQVSAELGLSQLKVEACKVSPLNKFKAAL